LCQRDLDSGRLHGNDLDREGRGNRGPIRLKDIILPAGHRLDEGQCLSDQRVAFPDPFHDPPQPPPFQQSGCAESSHLTRVAYFSRSPESARMDSGKERSAEVDGLRLIRAFRLLPPDRRAEVIAFVEELARAHGWPEEGTKASPR
jgi:hypothetical protein